MRIGLMVGPERGRYPTKVQRMQADARWAEEAGLASVWIPQIPDEFDALTAVTLVGVETGRIEIGTAVVPVQPRHPIALAHMAPGVAQRAEPSGGIFHANHLVHLHQIVPEVEAHDEVIAAAFVRVRRIVRQPSHVERADQHRRRAQSVSQRRHCRVGILESPDLAGPAHGVEDKRNGRDVVHVRVRDEDVVDQRELADRKIAHAGAGIDEHIVVEK